MKKPSYVKMAPIESWEAMMCGLHDKQSNMWAFVSIEERIASNHALRRIKTLADQRLGLESDHIVARKPRYLLQFGKRG